jgi:hypothetical protein
MYSRSFISQFPFSYAEMMLYLLLPISTRTVSAGERSGAHSALPELPELREPRYAISQLTFSLEQAFIGHKLS